MKKRINIVWLKRDLRTQDHKPLATAANSELDYIILFLYEPEFIQKADTSERHLQFQFHSIKDMNGRLEEYDQQVLECYGSALEVFSGLIRQYDINQVYSYQESGTQATWSRDKAIKKLLQEKNISWQESQRDGIQRGITNRKDWDKQWYATMSKELTTIKYSKSQLSSTKNEFALPVDFREKLESYPSEYQPAGETAAWKYLVSFCEVRGKNYMKHISKPEASRQACSRLSPFIAWGNLSIKQAYQFVKSHPNYQNHKRAFNAMLMRLKWHCHFIQKFEVECSYETKCINQGYEKLERTNNPDHLESWKKGQTGYPLIDACMRCVSSTGWINFRMRAMLVSFLCHHLDIDWRQGSEHLAQQFLDYEPGIHYPQFQMQAGTTGINTVRIYNPVKQSQDHDPTGEYIKKWVPELRHIPVEHIHEPWKMTLMEQQLYQLQLGVDYPSPIIDYVTAGRSARDKIWGHKKSPEVRAHRESILQKHTRNKKFRKK